MAGHLTGNFISEVAKAQDSGTPALRVGGDGIVDLSHAITPHDVSQEHGLLTMSILLGGLGEFGIGTSKNETSGFWAVTVATDQWAVMLHPVLAVCIAETARFGHDGVADSLRHQARQAATENGGADPVQTVRDAIERTKRKGAGQ